MSCKLWFLEYVIKPHRIKLIQSVAVKLKFGLKGMDFIYFRGSSQCSIQMYIQELDAHIFP
jgi:hypothetical protein